MIKIILKHLQGFQIILHNLHYKLSSLKFKNLKIRRGMGPPSSYK